MLAAEAVYEALGAETPPDEVTAYREKMESSWVWDELKAVRNIRPGFQKGLWSGLANAAWETYVTRGQGSKTLRNHADNATLRTVSDSKPIDYPKPDGRLTFDRLSSVFVSNTNHEENQPVHLKLKDPSVPVDHNLALYDAPEQRYCPAGVY